MITSQNLTNKEKRLYRYIQAKTSARVDLRKKMYSITRKYVNKDSAASKKIAQDIKAKVLQPYRKKHPNADANAEKWAKKTR
jgi:hypothetical protein